MTCFNSTILTFFPLCWNARASCVATVDFPTPPFPERTRIVRLTPGSISSVIVIMIYNLEKRFKYLHIFKIWNWMDIELPIHFLSGFTLEVTVDPCVTFLFSVTLCDITINTFSYRSRDNLLFLWHLETLSKNTISLSHTLINDHWKMSPFKNSFHKYFSFADVKLLLFHLFLYYNKKLKLHTDYVMKSTSMTWIKFFYFLLWFLIRITLFWPR